MKLAFTGTRQGMTAKQVVTVTDLVVLADPSEARHGVAIGSDAAFHRIVRTNKPTAKIIGYPPANPKYRDFTLDCGEWMPEADYGVRDRQLVEASEALIATPRGYKEELRSGYVAYGASCSQGSCALRDCLAGWNLYRRGERCRTSTPSLMSLAQRRSRPT